MFKLSSSDNFSLWKDLNVNILILKKNFSEMMVKE